MTSPATLPTFAAAAAESAAAAFPHTDDRVKSLAQLRLLGQQDEVTWKAWLAWLEASPATVVRLMTHAKRRMRGSMLANLKEIKRHARQLAQNSDSGWQAA